jgi:23S rRNA pseudouridine1911/1915/1917 synthase
VTELEFLYNDDSIFAVYKPAGIHSVRLPSGGGRSLADILCEQHPELEHAAPSPLDGGLVQRLDLETSGLLLGAKTPEVWQALYDALLAGKIEKSYVALVAGRVSDDISITSFLGSPHRGAQKVKIYEKEPAKKARALEGTTTFSPLQFIAEKNISVVKAVASPARRHQIRAHAAHLGHPLVGDALYGSTETLGPLSSSPRAFFLHAWELSFVHPISGRLMQIEADYTGKIVLPVSTEAFFG